MWEVPDSRVWKAQQEEKEGSTWKELTKGHNKSYTWANVYEDYEEEELTGGYRSIIKD